MLDYFGTNVPGPHLFRRKSLLFKPVIPIFTAITKIWFPYAT